MLIVAIGAPRPSCSFSPRRCPAPWRPDTRARPSSRWASPATKRAGGGESVNVHLPAHWCGQRALTCGRIKTNPRGWSPVLFGCRECTKRAPATIVPGSHSSSPGTWPDRQPTAFPGRFPQAVRIIIAQSKASRTGDHRTSFAPETIATGRNKRDRTRQIFTKINARDSCPAAHNGLVGGSSPPGPTIFNAFRARTLLDRSRMFAFSSRISLVNRWPTWEAHLVRDEGVAGSNPATPTST
jgi:hypothetical protein